MKYDLTFTNAAGQRETLTVRGPRCVAEWHAAKLRRQRVARAITIEEADKDAGPCLATRAAGEG
jgi:hypothetical protein